jgi:thioredoxin-like negative regulator of GroEL
MRFLANTGAIDVSLVGTDWWANISVIAAGVLTAVIAAGVAVIGYSYQKRAARRERCAQMYATAVQAIEDYLEGPYRIRRRDGTAEARNSLTQHLSDTKSSIEYHQTLLRIHASTEVAEAYETFAAAARAEAGPAMTAAWRELPTRRDRDVPLGSQLFDSVNSEAARGRLITAMRTDLKGRRG